MNDSPDESANTYENDDNLYNHRYTDKEWLDVIYMSKVLKIKFQDIADETRINFNSCKMFLRIYKYRQGIHFKH